MSDQLLPFSDVSKSTCVNWNKNKTLHYKYSY